MNYLVVALTYIIVILTMSIVAFIVVRKICRKIRSFSRQILGTDTLAEGFGNIQKEYEITPKSVSAMTSLCLPKIKKDFPEFQYDEMKARAENVLGSYLLAIDRNSPGELSEGGSELRQSLELHLSMLAGKGRREHYESIHIHRTEISDYRKRDVRCIITFQSALQSFYYLAEEDGSIIDGDRDTLTQAKYNVDVIYVQDRDKITNELDLSLGLNCPNCGAPVSGLGSKICEFCGTPVVELNIYAWTFSSIKKP